MRELAAGDGRVTVEARDGGVALVTLDRAHKRNALSLEIRTALAEALEDVAADEQVAAVVLTGAGSAFCAGMDVTQFGGDRAHKERIVETSVRLFGAVAQCPAPTVAAVNGPAVAGGFAIALLCDVRVAAPAARFGFPEVGRHIPPSYAAAAAALAPAVARDLCLTGRVVDAEEALALGVASRAGGLDVALATAAEIAAAPRGATREVKRRILLGGEATWAAILQEEERALREALLDPPPAG
jgi:enoyl-CoA hydratase/carnithine racemase